MTPEALGFLIHQSSIARSLRLGASLQALALRLGMGSDTIICNHTLNMYANCGDVAASRVVFEEMSDKNIVSWSAMISGYGHDGKHGLALQLFSKCDLSPNEHVFARVVSSCSNILDLNTGKQVHAQALKLGFVSIVFVSNALISMYMACSQSRDALMVYEEMLDPDVVTYNALVNGFGRNGQVVEALSVYKTMRARDLVPDRFTFYAILSKCNEVTEWRTGALLHCQTIKYKLDSWSYVGNGLMIMYANFNMVEDVVQAFQGIEDQDIVSWNTLIVSCSRCSDHERALKKFGEMLKEARIKPDDFTFATVLSACAGFPSLLHGKEIHAHLIRKLMNHDIGSCNSLINMYSKCGSIGYAYLVFRRMSSCNLLSWNTIIGGLAKHGSARRAIKVFEEMKLNEIQPDSLTFLGLLTACNHSGLVDEGLSIFNSLQGTYGISPEGEHLCCVVDLLGRSGRLLEAEEYMKRFTFATSPIVLGCFLSACQLQGNKDIGERIAKNLLQLQPVTSSPYVMLSNLYASYDMWDNVSATRRLLRGNGVKKEAGHSLIELKGLIHRFLSGEPCPSNPTEIQNILNTFSFEASKKSLESNNILFSYPFSI